MATVDPVAVQAAGGIRSLADAEALLEAGARRVVVGTAAFADDGALERYASAFGERLVVAIDVRDGRVAVEGWERSTTLDVLDAVDRCRAAGVHRILCTAIERDGTLDGARRRPARARLRAGTQPGACRRWHPLAGGPRGGRRPPGARARSSVAPSSRAGSRCPCSAADSDPERE